MKANISIVKCGSYSPALVQEKVRQSLDSLGGVSAFIKPQSKVLVKPNLLSAKAPESGVDTHPEVVRAVIKLLKGIDCRVYLGDGPSVWGAHIKSVDDVYEISGMKKVAQDEGVQLVRFDNRKWYGKFPLTTWLTDCDYFVSIPKFKTHNLTVLTGAIKNLYGLVWGTYKIELHKKYFEKEDFAGIIVDIYAAARPALTIIDGIVAMEGDGPGSSGILRNTGLLLAGSDCVALDSVLALIMGIKPFDVLTTKKAAQRGLGLADMQSISILGERLEDVTDRPFILPSASINYNIAKPIINIAKRLIRYYPCVEEDNCIKCAACIKACPHKIITLKNERISIDYKKCLACFCCQEVCPASAIKIKKSLLAKIIGL